MPGFQPKTSSFWLSYQRPSSSADCAEKLFKSSNGCLLVCTQMSLENKCLLVCTRKQTKHAKTNVFLSALEKKFLVGGCENFVSDVISEIVFGPFWLMLHGLGLSR